MGMLCMFWNFSVNLKVCQKIFLKVNKNKKNKGKKCGPQISSIYTTESLLVLKMIRTHSRLAESESAFFQKILRSIIECTVKVEKPCSLPQTWDLASAQPCLVLKHILVSILSHCLFIKTQTLFSTWLRSINSVSLLGPQSLYVMTLPKGSDPILYLWDISFLKRWESCLWSPSLPGACYLSQTSLLLTCLLF